MFRSTPSSNKANNTGPTVRTDLFEWASAATAGTAFLVYPDTPNAPIANTWYGGVVFLTAASERMIILKQAPANTIWTIQTNGGVWNFADWQPLATATPPQELDLPLAEGFTAAPVCKCWKAQDGECKTNVRIAFNAVAYGQICATAPPGYRPLGVRTVTFSAYLNGGGSVLGYADMPEDGTLRLYPDVQITVPGTVILNPFIYVAAQ